MKSVLVIGLGRFGKYLSIALKDQGCEIMGVDISEERLEESMDYVTQGIIGNSTNLTFLKSLGVRNYDVCYVTISSNFQMSLETTSLLSELGAKKIIARAAEDVQAKFLLKNGADHVVYPEREMGRWAAIRYTSENVLDYIEIDPQASIIEIKVPGKWADKALEDLDIRQKYNLNIVGIRKKGTLVYFVSPDTIFGKDDSILVLGSMETLKKCFKI